MAIIPLKQELAVQSLILQRSMLAVFAFVLEKALLLMCSYIQEKQLLRRKEHAPSVKSEVFEVHIFSICLIDGVSQCYNLHTFC